MHGRFGATICVERTQATMRRMLLAVVILCAFIALTGAAQQPSPSLTFEVASVKPGDPRIKLPGFRVTPSGQWFVQNSTVVEIIGRTFPDFTFPGVVVGGPPWAQETRFTIDARAAGSTSVADLQAMGRNLLVERFRLRTHVEQRPVDLYALVLAREDGRLGAGLRPSSAECVAARSVIPRNPFPAECPSDSGQSATGTRISERGWRISQLVAMLQPWIDRGVIDRTGLAGHYDMDFVFDFASVRGIEEGANLPSIFTALQDHLGLKLERRHEPMNVLVIDSVEPPTPD